MKDKWLPFPKLFRVVLFLSILFVASCASLFKSLNEVHLKVVNQYKGGFLFIDTINQERSYHNTSFLLEKDSLYTIVYSESKSKGVFSMPRQSYFSVSVSFPSPGNYSFRKLVDPLSNTIPTYEIRQENATKPIKTWNESNRIPHEF